MTILIDSRLIKKPIKKELMQKLNKLLGTDYNWSRLNKLDLERLVISIENQIWKVKKNQFF